MRRYALYFAWLLSSLGTLGSLFFSEIWHLEPCSLCWYQRIFLFPLPIILGIAAYDHFSRISRYTLPLILLGMLTAAYQIAIQEIPDWNPIDICGAQVSCSDKIDIGLGAITIPMLSFALFLLIGTLLLISSKREKV